MMRSFVVALLLAPAVADAAYEASSYKKEAKLGSNYWNAASALDSNPATCWQIDPEQPAVGSSVWLDIPAAEVDRVGAIIGWDKDEATFRDYSRIKKARVEVMDAGQNNKVVGESEVSFEDKQGWQVVDIPDVKVGGEFTGGRVKITVLEVYPGTDFPHLAVSELRVDLKQFPAASQTFVATPDTEAGTNTGDLAIDGNPKTFWAATQQTATFSMKAPGFGLSTLKITPGPKTHARPKTVEVTAQQTTVTHTLTDSLEPQEVLLPYLVGFSGGAWGEIAIKITDSYPGEPAGAGVAISELQLMAGSIEAF